MEALLSVWFWRLEKTSQLRLADTHTKQIPKNQVNIGRRYSKIGNDLLFADHKWGAF
jgi:hypothetical protein